MAFVEYKQEGLWKAHLIKGIFTLCISGLFSAVFSNNTNLHGTLFPKVYWVQHVGYMLSGIMELGTSLLMYRAPHFRANHAVLMQFILGLWFVFVLGLDPYRTFYILDPETTYAKELEKWVILFEPNLDYVTSCGGYVLSGEQRCYFNSYEVVYSNMTLCLLATTGFYMRLPPYAFLLLVHMATALRAAMMISLGSANTSLQVSLVDISVSYMLLLVIFAGVRRNDEHMRITFFLQQQTRRDAERTAERLQSEKERLGWDVHLVTKRLETVQQESVGGDRQENAGVRSGLLAQAAVSVSSSLHAPSGSVPVSLPPAPPSSQAESVASAPSYHPSQKAPSVAESATSIDMTLAIDEMGRDERADLVARELVLKVGAPATLQVLDTIDRCNMPPPLPPPHTISLREELAQSWLGALLQLGREARSGRELPTKEQNSQIRKKRRHMEKETRAGAGAVRAMPMLHSPPVEPRAAPLVAFRAPSQLEQMEQMQQEMEEQEQAQAQAQTMELQAIGPAVVQRVDNTVADVATKDTHAPEIHAPRAWPWTHIGMAPLQTDGSHQIEIASPPPSPSHINTPPASTSP